MGRKSSAKKQKKRQEEREEARAKQLQGEVSTSCVLKNAAASNAPAAPAPGPTQEAAADPRPIHWGTCCDVCDMDPLRGDRHQCAVCDFDVCGGCVASVDHPHPLVLVPPPAQAANPAKKRKLTEEEKQARSAEKLALKRAKRVQFLEKQASAPRAQESVQGSFASCLKPVVLSKVSHSTGVAIFARLCAIFEEEEGVTAPAVLARDTMDMVKCGLSKAKVEACKSAARLFLEKEALELAGGGTKRKVEEPVVVDEKYKKHKKFRQGKLSTKGGFQKRIHLRRRIR